MCRLMTPQLKEALKGYPFYSQDGRGKEAVCMAIFALGSVRWFVLEGEVQENDTIFFRHCRRAYGGRVRLLLA